MAKSKIEWTEIPGTRLLVVRRYLMDAKTVMLPSWPNV